jgi:hypothetical protein
MPLDSYPAVPLCASQKFLDERKITLALDHERTRQFLHGLHLDKREGNMRTTVVCAMDCTVAAAKVSGQGSAAEKKPKFLLTLERVPRRRVLA